MPDMRQTTKDRIIFWTIVFPTIPIWVPTYGTYLLSRHIKKRIRYEDRHYTSLPLPLSLHRKYNLSDESLLQAQPVGNKPTLLTLPYEIRMRIYNHLVAGNSIIYIGEHPTQPRLIHDAIDYPYWWDSNQHIPDAYSVRGWEWNQPTWDNERKQWLNMPNTNPMPYRALLLTCRQTYQEAVPVIYSTNTFAFKSLYTFIYFARTTRMQRLAQIKFLSIDIAIDSFMLPVGHDGGFIVSPTGNRLNRRPPGYHNTAEEWNVWAQTWKTISKGMPNLRELDCRVALGGGGIMGGSEKPWLECIKPVRGLRRFNLNLLPSEWDMPSRETDKYRMEIVRAARMPRGVDENMRLRIEEELRMRKPRRELGWSPEKIVRVESLDNTAAKLVEAFDFEQILFDSGEKIPRLPQW
jgi:hypothetical protein